MDLISFVLVAALAVGDVSPARAEVAAAPPLPAVQLFDALPGCQMAPAGDRLDLTMFDQLPGCQADVTTPDPLDEILQLVPADPLPRTFSMPNLRPRPTVRAEPIEPEFRVTIASPPWCLPCKTMRADVGTGNGRVGVDWLVEPVDQLPEWARRIAKAHDRWPVIRFECDGQIRYQSGIRTLDQLEQLCE
jgi:hypothetical protein